MYPVKPKLKVGLREKKTYTKVLWKTFPPIFLSKFDDFRESRSRENQKLVK